MGEELTRPKLLLVEGVEEVKLFSALMKYLDIEGIQVKGLSGKSSLPDKLGAVKNTPGFNEVTSLGVVRDADASAKDVFASVRGALRDNQLPCPAQPMETAPGEPSVTVLIVPHGANAGMLEDVCLQSVQRDPAMECLDNYFACLKERLGQMPTSMAKARVHAFLASRREPDLRLGEAAGKEGYWNFDSTAFDALKQLVRLL